MGIRTAIVRMISFDEARNLLADLYVSAVTPEQIRANILSGKSLTTRQPLGQLGRADIQSLVQENLFALGLVDVQGYPVHPTSEHAIDSIQLFDESNLIYPVYSQPLRKFQRVVAAGIALLDKHMPNTWRDRIDWGTLELQCSGKCVMSQIFGGIGYEAALEQFNAAYGTNLKWCNGDVEYGFNMPRDVTKGFTELTAEWKLQGQPK
jgi:hypothetical protein